MTLSKEELRSIIDSDHVQCGDAAAMARELLDRRERDKQEPVYQVQYGQQWRDVSRERYNDHIEHGSKVRIVYAAPPALVVDRQAIINKVQGCVAAYRERLSQMLLNLR